ncbi:J domain-containing protein [Hyalangium rubrum]|uniref:J domain-containing protein n=1 Tax=Hyalangium rubrum TaxID=3103134 RepID=A0ABU5GXI6_9BACT|nr:J domain-containing protein [Hyalangium sp. s54d21]MDY7225902.1 J domain-containing protein [Hyalangium sp. s54d21]
MVHVLFFSDRQVRDKLFALVDGTRGPLLVTGVRHGPSMRPPEEREPFDTLEASFGHTLTQVLVADEGTVEGMWRDPLGDLGERLYPRSKQEAYAASSGFLLLEGGRPRAVLRKRGVPREDLWYLQEALSQLSSRIPAPDPARKPGPRRQAAPSGARAGPGDPTPPRGTRAQAEPPPPPPQPTGRDPWQVLGIAPGTPKEEAKRAFRALVTRYHPDKVAHMAPEFQELAERKTRELLEAWAELEKTLA